MVNHDFADYNNFQVYVFSLYWVFQSITTVGYGDYTGNRSIEYMFTMVLEFLGVTFFSIMTARMRVFAQREGRYEDLLWNRMQGLDVWVQKLERANSSLHISPSLYTNILTFIEDAMKMDYNLIIEEFTFYQTLPPKAQTDLVNFLFHDIQR